MNADGGPHSVDIYQGRLSWFQDSQFLKDLENDSVDSDIIDEELGVLQEANSLTRREKVVKLLQSSPVQVLLCLAVLLDAGIVIAQILLDLHAVKAKVHRREEELNVVLQYIKETRSAELNSYTGNDINHILQLLKEHRTARWKTGPIQDAGRSNSDVTATSITSTHVTEPARTIDEQRRLAVACRNYYRTRTAERRTNTSRMVDGNATVLKPSGSMPKGVAGRAEDSVTETSDAIRPEVIHNKEWRFTDTNDVDLLHDVAHGLHFASIGVLGFLVLEDLVKIISMGRDFFRHKIEIFDAIIICLSFAIDIVLLKGVNGEEGTKAGVVLIILLLWRITRVADGILVTIKQRQEFRIRIQKRARRKAEKRIEQLENEGVSRERQVSALKDLCSKAGIRDMDVHACVPTQHRRVSSTVCALGSVARLSVSMTMSISSGLYSLSNADVSKPDSTSSNVDFSRSLTDFQRYDSVPEAADDEEDEDADYSDDGVLYMGSLAGKTSEFSTGREDKALAVLVSEPSSPINTSGVRIVVNEGSECHSGSGEDLPARDFVDGAGGSYLAVAHSCPVGDGPATTGAGFIEVDMDDTARPYCSSQQHLLKDMS